MNEQISINKEVIKERDYLEAWKKAKAEVKDDDFIKSINVPPQNGDLIKNIQWVDIFHWLPQITQYEFEKIGVNPDTVNVKVIDAKMNEEIIDIEISSIIEKEFAGILEKKEIKIPTKIKKVMLESYGKHHS